MVVGHLVGKLTKIIVEKSLPTQVKLYCVSFSLGSHVCGFIGKVIKFAGIIALDPSGPIFERSSDDGRLSKNDAEAVYVLHTNYKFIGLRRPVGDVDFYVNGGSFQALHCSSSKSIKGLSDCHHMFSLNIFFHMQRQNCKTNVFCPIQNPASIDDVKFPQINVTGKVVKEWVNIEGRGSLKSKGKVSDVVLILNAILLI